LQLLQQQAIRGIQFITVITSNEANMTGEEVHQLVHLVCENGAFRGKREHLGREEQVLRYLATHWTLDPISGQQKLSAEAIARVVLNRKVDGIALSTVRVYLARVRQTLEFFFRHVPAGRNCSRRIELPDGVPYVLLVTPNTPKLDAAERFWDVHIINGIENWLVYAEPLVFYDPERRRYLRYLDINCDSLDEEEVRRAVIGQFGPDHEALRFVPSFQYQPSGQIEALQTLTEFFRQNDLQVEQMLTRRCSPPDVFNQNIIVLGSPRTNRYVRHFQREFDFKVEPDRVTVAAPDCPYGEESVYEDSKLSAQHASRTKQHVYAVLTRTPNLHSGAHTTLIAANDGRAIERVAAYITNERKLVELYSLRDYFRAEGPLPQKFQIIFRVGIAHFEMVFDDAEPVACRAYMDHPSDPRRGA
jgi:hypothetical protein